MSRQSWMGGDGIASQLAARCKEDSVLPFWAHGGGEDRDASSISVPRLVLAGSSPEARDGSSPFRLASSRGGREVRDSAVEACLKLCNQGHIADAVASLSSLVQVGSHVPTFLFYAILKRCLNSNSLVLGQRIHALAVQSGYESNPFLANHIMRMYAKHGRVQEAMRVFGRVATPDAFMWSTIISAYVEDGDPGQAIKLYHQMCCCTSVVPDAHIFVAALKACVSALDLDTGVQVHAYVKRRGLQHNVFIGSCLVDMYAKCGSLQDSRAVFDSLPKKDVVIWTAMITRYAEQGLCHEAFALYTRMEQEGILLADNITFACLLKACAGSGALQQGKQLHSQIVQRGLDADVVLGSCLVDMYAKCGSLQDARNVFDSLAVRDVVSWTAMIDGCVRHGFGYEALHLYERMKQEGKVVANDVTFSCLLKACASVGAIKEGKQLHMQIVEHNLESDLVLGNCLVDMYAKCGSLDDARKVFDSLPTRDVVTWTAMIAGYAEHGLGLEALDVYARMEEEGLLAANKVTFCCLVKACASVGALAQGRKLHARIVDSGYDSDLVLCSCVVDMYAKCGSLEDARKVFDSLPTRDVVAWNAMIAGYTDHGLGQEALALYAGQEQEAKALANSCTYSFLLKACANIGAIQQGKQLHSQILERGLIADTSVAASLVDMYAKCGSLKDARDVFDSLSERDVITWTALLNGYGKCNQGQQAIQCFQDMLKDGVQPDETSFTCLFVACSHEGLVDVGRHFFNTMVTDHSMVPTLQHYLCMVDLLGRSGHLEDAEKLLLGMPFESDVVGWTTLLYACRSYGEIERGIRCFENVIRLDPQNASAYVLMGNLYADAGRWIDVNRIESLRRSVGASKKPAKAGIEVNRQVCTFVVGEETDVAFSTSQKMNVRLRDDGGHVPHTELVLKPVSEKEKTEDLCGHAEKLALAYGLLNTPDGTPLLVTKNLRMCGDCHSATQVMSRVEKREIVVRDAHRVHRFAEGCCSCGDRP